jgi:hypothetical protein
MSHLQKVSQSTFPSLTNSQEEKTEKATTFYKNRIFALIDSVLSLENCLFYQILPLELTTSCLTLGMVKPENPAALNYIRSFCVDKGYTWEIHQLNLQQYQSLLAAYSQRSSGQSVAPASSSKFQERPTLIIDSPEQLEWKLANSEKKHPYLTASEENTFLDSQTKQVTSLLSNISIQPLYLGASPEFLAILPPQVLWQELLARILYTGKGRLVLERLADCGRIFWSHNGTIILTLESLIPQHFQAVLNEFKRLVNLSTAPVKEVHIGELERSYQQERVLIRWRISPGKYGEEGTLQVLQGKALELYQQRQINLLEEEALTLAKQLERKLNQIRRYQRINSSPLSQIASLRRLQKLIKRQLELLK